MNAELPSALSELRSLAERRNWADVRGLAEHLLDERPTPSVLLAVAGGQAPGEFQKFVRALLPEAALNTVPAERLPAGAPALVEADRMVVLLPCVRLLDADVVEAANRLAGLRLPGTYAIALVAGDMLADADDVAMVDRSVSRLFGPERVEYLWDAGEGREHLRARLERDRAALVAWLTRPVAPAERRERGAVLAAVELAERHMLQPQGPGAEERVGRSQRLLDQRESLLELRRRLLHWLDAQTASLERELTASLRAAEQDLLYGVRPHLRRWVAERPPALPARLRDHLRAWLREWEQQASGRLAQRIAEITADGQALLDGADWSLVNEVAGKRGWGPYPEALLKELSLRLSPLVADGLPEVGGGRKEEHQAPSMLDLRTLLGVGAAGTLGAAVLSPLGLGILGAVLGGATGAIGGALLKSHLRQEHSVRDAEDYSRSVIVEVARKLVEQVRAATHQMAQPTRDRLADGLRGLEALLDDAIDEARKGATAPAEAPADRQIIERCRVALSGRAN